MIFELFYRSFSVCDWVNHIAYRNINSSFGWWQISFKEMLFRQGFRPFWWEPEVSDLSSMGKSRMEGDESTFPSKWMAGNLGQKLVDML